MISTLNARTRQSPNYEFIIRTEDENSESATSLFYVQLVYSTCYRKYRNRSLAEEDDYRRRYIAKRHERILRKGTRGWVNSGD